MQQDRNGNTRAIGSPYIVSEFDLSPLQLTLASTLLLNNIVPCATAPPPPKKKKEEEEISNVMFIQRISRKRI